MSSKAPYRKQRRPFIKGLLIALACILLIGLILFFVDRRDWIDVPFIGNDKDSSQSSTQDSINYGPPTEEEKRETEEFKENQGSSTTQPSTTTPSTQKKSVTPIISSWPSGAQSGDIQVSGFVPNIVENGGQCTLTLSKSGQDVTTTATGEANAQSVSCGTMTITRDRLSAGKWNVKLSYSSTTYEGTSQQDVTVEVK